MIQYQRLGDALVAQGLVTEEKIKQALETQFQSGLRLGEILIGMGIIREADLTKCLATQYGFDIVDLSTVVPEPDALALTTPGFALAHLLLPLKATSTEMTCAIADPLDLVATDTTAQNAHRRVSIVLAGPTELYNAIQKAYGLGYTPEEAPIGQPKVAVKAFKAPRGRRDTQEDRRALLALFDSKAKSTIKNAA